ncbi:MAG: hypothetical protein IKS52_11425 [Clostridia bacterium]|nr:hypothetical protein [Clostridia bacterium]MBO4886195.1 hypothetical protein [Clostridia bacterium]MBR4443864.1 hypothetical protein [Clostridia bacterium]
MKEKWLSGLALVLAALLFAGVASAQCQVTITYDKLSAAVGENIRASYTIEGLEHENVSLYWRIALTDRQDVMDPDPQKNYGGVNYWSGSVNAVVPTGSTAVRTVGAGFVQLVADEAEGGIAVAYPQGDGLVRVDGEAYVPIHIAFNREKAWIGDTVIAYYDIQGMVQPDQYILGAWFWHRNGEKTAYEQFELDARTGSETLTIPADMPSDATGLSFVITITYASGYHAAFEAEQEIVLAAPDDSDPNARALRRDDDGVFRLYRGTALDTNYFGIVSYETGRFLVANGLIAAQSGLTSDGVNWYYLADGQVVDYTGLVLYDGAWFYVRGGMLDASKAGLVPYDGRLFMVGGGRILTEVNGMMQDPETGAWYYLAGGQVTDYTGIVLYDGALFYVSNGRLATEFSDVVSYDGVLMRVECGQVVEYLI